MTSSMPSDLAIFSSAPDARHFQPLGSIEQCRVQLDHMLRHDAGLGLLIGPPGTGKSLLCQLLADNLRDAFEVVVLADSTPRDQLSLLQNILFQLNMPYRDCSEGELRLSLIDRLTHGAHAASKGLILIVDEAQSLPDAILEEIRMITNIVRGGKSCVRTILAGNHELEERIGQPRFESLAQRIAVRCYLHPLDIQDAAGYIRARLLRHPAGPQLEEQAAKAVHLATGGVPRLIHQLMRQVLVVSGTADITGEHVELAWKQLHPLASPVMEPELLTSEPELLTSEPELLESEPENPPEPESSREQGFQHKGESIIEFGELTSDDDALPSGQTSSAGETPSCSETSSCSETPLAGETTIGFWYDENEQDESEAEHAGDEPAAERQDQGREPAAAEPSNRPAVVAEDMPELAAQLDRVTDSLLRMAQPQEDQTQCDEPTLETPQCDEPTLEMPQCDEPTLETPRCDEPKIEPADLFGDGFEVEEPVPGLQPLVPASPEGAEGPEHELHCEVACISVEAATIQFEDEPAAVVPAIGTDGVGTGESLGDDICLNDDSDMLIVEDVVDAEPAPLRSPVYDDDPSDSVDYQRLLNRMRQG